MIYLDESKIVIKQYEKIITLTSDCMHIQMLHHTLILKGEGFIVLYLSKDEIHIRGKMKEVKFRYD